MEKNGKSNVFGSQGGDFNNCKYFIEDFGIAKDYNVGESIQFGTNAMNDNSCTGTLLDANTVYITGDVY